MHLEDAGYITVGLVGLRLLLRVVDYDSLFPEWAMIAAIAILFTWGFSKRTPELATGDADEAKNSTDAEN